MEKRKIEFFYEPRATQQEIHNLISQNRFSVIVAHRRLGKTVCMINQIIKKAITDKSGDGRYGYIAPYRSQAKTIAWDYLKNFTAPLGELRKVNESELTIDFANGARIRIFFILTVLSLMKLLT